MTYDSFRHATEERAGQAASTMGAENHEVSTLVLSHLDQGPTRRGVLNHAQLHLGDPLEQLRGLTVESLANRLLDFDPNAPL